MMKLRIMLIDEDRGRGALLRQALRDADYEVAALLSPNQTLLKQIQEVSVDVIIINLDAPDRDTLEYLSMINQTAPKPIVMFSESEDRETIRAAIKAGVSAYVVDGLNRKRLRAILEVAIARFREYQAMREELEKARHQLAERKVIERAKGLLMKQKNLDEEEAYHALRKMAMNRNMRLVDVAENVIAIAKLLI